MWQSEAALQWQKALYPKKDQVDAIQFGDKRQRQRPKTSVRSSRLPSRNSTSNSSVREDQGLVGRYRRSEERRAQREPVSDRAWRAVMRQQQRDAVVGDWTQSHHTSLRTPHHISLTAESLPASSLARSSRRDQPATERQQRHSRHDYHATAEYRSERDSERDSSPHLVTGPHDYDTSIEATEVARSVISHQLAELRVRGAELEALYHHQQHLDYLPEVPLSLACLH